jgi:MFS family permease
MSTVSNSELLGRINQQRAQVDAFLASAVPRKRRLLNTTIVGGSLAAALTAGPAVGGPSFTAWLTAALGLTSPSWRLLCGGAAVCSIMATVATQLLKSDNVEQNVTRAQGARAKLEVLELGLKIGQLDERQALAEYLKCVEETAFLVGS